LPNLFNLAALKVRDFTYDIILVPFTSANSNNTVQTQHTAPIKFGTESIFAPLNFAVFVEVANFAK